MPLVSVLMSNYNTNEQYLREAIESILNQTLTDFEFIIIDDASTDGSLKVIESYLYDKRVKIIENKINLGLAKSLNKGLSIAKGDYIARADSDDIYYPERLEKQVNWMQNHPDYIVCGTWFEKFGNEHGIYNKVINDIDYYRICLLFSNNPAIPHTSAMFSRELLIKSNIMYDERYLFAQDYQMWVQCSRVSKLYILEEVLTRVRINPKGISVSKKNEQRYYARQVIEDQLIELHLSISDELFFFHENMFSKSVPVTYEVKQWMKTILNANKKYNVYNQKKLKQLFKNNWHKRIKRNIKDNHSINNIMYSIRNYCF